MATAGDEDQVTQLAKSAGRGDRVALTQFIEATRRDVWRTVAYLADPASADDLTQETYLRAIKSLPRFSGRSTAKTWLLSIARRVVVTRCVVVAAAAAVVVTGVVIAPTLPDSPSTSGTAQEDYQGQETEQRADLS